MPLTQAQGAAAESLSDEELVSSRRARDEAAVRAITNRYNRRLFRVARSILRDDAEAEDVVQETYVRAFTGLDMFRGDAAFGTWITRIAMNEALGRLRRRRPTVDWETYGETATRRRSSISGLGGGQRSGENNGAKRNPCRSGKGDRRASRFIPRRLRCAHCRRHECRGNRRSVRPAAGNREDKAASRALAVARNWTSSLAPRSPIRFPFGGHRCEP